MKIKSIVQSETDLMFVSFRTEPGITQELVDELKRKLRTKKEAKFREILLKNGCLTIPASAAKSKNVELLEKLLTKAEATVSERKKRNALVLKRFQDKISAKLGLHLE